MPIKSYIAIPHPDSFKQLVAELGSMVECQVHPAENKEILVLVTDTLSEDEDKVLVGRIEQSKYLAHLSFVSGFDE